MDNPNLFPIPFPKTDWNYEVNGVPLVRGSLASEGEIAAGTQGKAVITVSTTYADILAALGGFAGAEEDSLMKMSTLLPEGFPGASTLNLETPAKLRIPKISFSRITIKNVAPGKLDFIAVWEINNPNTFALNLSEFCYNFSVNNSTWAKDMLDMASRLEAGTKTTIPLEFSINAVSILRDVVTIINRGAGIYFTNTGNFTVDGELPGLVPLHIPFDLWGFTHLLR